jgi:hypothetical protein
MIGIIVVPMVLFFPEEKEKDRRSCGRCLYTWLTECGVTMADGLFTGRTTSLTNQPTMQLRSLPDTSSS